MIGMTDDEVRGWISQPRAHGVHINAGTLSDLASEVLSLRRRLMIADSLADAASDVAHGRTDENSIAFLANRLASYRATQPNPANPLKGED